MLPIESLLIRCYRYKIPKKKVDLSSENNQLEAEMAGAAMFPSAFLQKNLSKCEI